MYIYMNLHMCVYKSVVLKKWIRLQDGRIPTYHSVKIKNPPQGIIIFFSVKIRLYLIVYFIQLKCMRAIIKIFFHENISKLLQWKFRSWSKLIKSRANVMFKYSKTSISLL